jgi:hypothetical protein
MFETDPDGQYTDDGERENPEMPRQEEEEEES